MKRVVTISALGLALLSCRLACGGGDGRDVARGPHPLSRLGPAGGWHPYGGGLLHWWNPHCFPRYCSPDDYCRKPPPRVCWPPYPPVYTFGQAGLSDPRSDGLRHFQVLP
jgi:hypothetical protein